MGQPTVLALLVVVLSALTTPTSQLYLTNGSYHDVTVEIDESVSVPDNCTEILKIIETTLENASRHLYVALDGLVHFNSFSVILPATWPDTCIPANKTVDRSRGDSSDLTITGYHQVFGDQIWTQQSGGCGERGDQMFATLSSFRRSFAANELTKEWIKYRYGVFDEVGYESDSIYPRCYSSDRKYVTGCSTERIIDNGFCENETTAASIDPPADSSLLFAPELDATLKVCNERTHDRYAPTKQNFLCDRRSVREVILKSADFAELNSAIKSNTSQPPALPAIHYRRRSLTRYVVVIDETQDIFVRESWSFLRNAIRKWLVYDLQKNTEVGIVLANDTSADKVMTLTALDMAKNRDLVASFIPYIPSDSPQSACITCGLRQAMSLLAARRRTNGFASEVVLIIAPGMDYRRDDFNVTIDWARGNRTRFVTINFPTLVRHRPLDELAHLTAGQAFTVFEQKYNSEKSFLNTYFDLTTILFHISTRYFEGAQSQLPVEIHRKELVDKANDSNSSKRINRIISGNFYLDEAMTTPSGFFIYTHNVEVPLIQSVKLTSPGGITYGTRSDQRIPVKQITIIASVNQTGPWSYRIERFNGNPQPHYVQVLATPANTEASIVRARAWLRKSESGGPVVLYCEVKRGGYPVHSAYVEVRITRPAVQCNYTNSCVERLKLLDTGSGDPDITKGDGIYSRYYSLAVGGPGLYRFDILVDDNGNTAYALPMKAEINLVESARPVACCGSIIPDLRTKQIPPFQRYLPPITITVSRNETDAELNGVVGRIGDLVGTFIGDGKARLAWTAPDMGGHNVAQYEVRYALNIFDIVNNFDTVASIWTHATPYPYSIGDVTNFIVDANFEPSLYGTAVFLAIRPFAKLGADVVPGLVSNPVRVFIPRRPDPTTPTPEIADDEIRNGEDGYDLGGAENDSTAGRSPVNTSNFKEYTIAIALGIFLICVITIIYLIFCITQRRRRQAAKRNGLCNREIETHRTIETLPSSETKPDNVSPEPIKNIDHFAALDHTAQLNHNSNNYQAMEPPDHHIIGLPLCPDRGDYQKKDYLGRFTPTLYSACGTVSVISANDGGGGATLTRHGRMLSPYESWTASQLLHEHECRVSPVGDLMGPPAMDMGMGQTMSYDAPPVVPPLPYHSDPYQIYSDTMSESGGAQQRPFAIAHNHNASAYSTIRRNIGATTPSQQLPQGGGLLVTPANLTSASSVSSQQDSTLNLPMEKKRRNVTMV